MASFFITTAIDYVNGLPHLGHAYEKVLADAVARWHRARGDDVFFLTGVDEHGQKVQQSAQKRGIEPKAFCDEMSGHFRRLCEGLGTSHDRFARTTEDSHKRVVRQFLQQLHDAGDIYFEQHEGFYSVRQEQFVTEKDMVDGQWPEIFGEVLSMKEPNYFFRLSKYQDWLRKHAEDHPDWIYPAFRRNEVLGALEKPLGDLCISRPKSRLAWGIPLPFDEDYVTYVWFDALVNYVSFSGWGEPGCRWPADVHTIGKDILVPAHGIYWPIMLRALGMEQPRHFLVHGWWHLRGEKMSKTTGNVIDPLELVDRYGADAFRYYVLREMTVGQDADFSPENFATRYRSDLGNDFGNLVNRAISMIRRYRAGIVPAAAIEPAVKEAISEARNGVAEAMDNFETHRALERIARLTQRGNQFVDERAPWKLAKDPAQAAALDSVLATLAETVRILSILVEPFLPTTAGRIQQQLGMDQREIRFDASTPDGRLAGRAVGEPQPLFPRIE